MTICLDELNTGDILLFSEVVNTNCFLKLFDCLIRCCTCSKFTHTAIVLKDPTWIDPNLTGLYAYESGIEPKPDEEDHTYKFGVQLTKLEDIIKNGSPKVYVRTLLKGTISTDQLREIHKLTKNKMYDFYPRDLIRTVTKPTHDLRYQHTDSFFCSALVSYICVKFGFLPETLDWSIISPGDLSSKSRNEVPWNDNVLYSNNILLEL